jgi:hypothetical protein
VTQELLIALIAGASALLGAAIGTVGSSSANSIQSGAMVAAVAPLTPSSNCHRSYDPCIPDRVGKLLAQVSHRSAAA